MIFKTKAKNLVIEYASARVTVIDGVPIKTKAKKIIFSDGRFDTADPKLIKIIKDNWMFKKKRIVVFDPDEQKKLQLQSDVGKQMVDLMKETGLTLEQLKARVASMPKDAGSTEPKEEQKKEPAKSAPPAERVQGGKNTPPARTAPAKSAPPAGNTQTNQKPGFSNKKKK